jgi:hypothetical protein
MKLLPYSMQYVIRHKGARHAGSAAVDFSRVFDVIALILVTSAVGL